MKTKQTTNEVNVANKKFMFMQYFSMHKTRVFMSIVWAMFSIVFTTITTIYGAQVIVKVTNGEYLAAIYITIGLCVNQLAKYLFTIFDNLNYFKLQLAVTRQMSFDIVEQSFNISSKAYTDHNTANFTRRIGTDPWKIFGELSRLITLVSQTLNSIIIVAYIAYLNWIIGVCYIACVVVGAIIEKYRRDALRRRYKAQYKNSEVYNSLLNEIIRSERDIKSLNLEKELKHDLTEKFNQSEETQMKNSAWSSNTTILKNSLFWIFMTGILVLSIYLRSVGAITLSTYLILEHNRGYANVLISCIDSFLNIKNEIGLAVERISELYQDDEYPLEKYGKVNRKHIKGKVEFKDVGFTYVTYKQRDEKDVEAEKRANKRRKINASVRTYEEAGRSKVFENLSFEIEPNTTVAFVGKSGSGKSTILNLISKMYTVDNGKVLIDGININNLDKQTLRSSISLVNQFPYIFDMSIKDNLLLAKSDASDEEINSVVKDAALDEFVDTLPNKLDTVVGESGIKLSGGQKQRLAIARALLRKSSIILFDESTSSLDNIAQAQIKKSIDNIKGKSTVVIVAHRLSTIRNVDKIFFLENGKITDIGTFDELFKRNQAFKTIFLAENI